MGRLILVVASQLEIATNNFDIKQLLYGSLYKGFIQGRAVFVKRCTSESWKNRIRGIVVASRLSAHKNVLKLIGCCLETEVPRVVYESFDAAELLHDCFGLLPWKYRLKIAVDLSNIVAYLHTALPRPLVYRDIKPSNIVLDKENGIVKLCNFEQCLPLLEEDLFVEEEPVVGTFGYLDPEYMSTNQLNEKIDVCGYRVTLLNLLSGRLAVIDNISLVFHARDCVENGRFEEILDPRLSTDIPWPGKDGQFKDVLMLALECTRNRGVDRPDMTEVGTRLERMYRSGFSDS